MIFFCFAEQEKIRDYRGDINGESCVRRSLDVALSDAGVSLSITEKRKTHAKAEMWAVRGCPQGEKKNPIGVGVFFLKEKNGVGQLV